MTTLVNLAVDKKPEDFKTAVVAELNNRLQSAINDKREEMTVAVFGEELVNKHDKTEEKKSGNVAPAADPKASAPGAMGHEQTDEKKTGKKKATPPSSVKEEADKDDDKDMDDKGKSDDDKPKSKDSKSDDDKDMDDKSKSKDDSEDDGDDK